MEIINTSGRRKTSVARVYLSPGKGTVTVNNKPLTTFFCVGAHQIAVNQPFEVTDNVGNYDVVANVRGGGIMGQAHAVSLAISKALVVLNEENRKPLRDKGLMTRDARMVERKKPGQKKARKKFQFSKR